MMYRNAVRGRTMLCSTTELIKGGSYLRLGYRYFFIVGNVGGTESIVMIVYSKKQPNTYIRNIYFVQIRGIQNS